VLVEGRLQSRSWETDAHEKRSILEVVAERVQFLSSRRAEGEGGGGAGSSDPGPGEPPEAPSTGADDIPF